MNVNGYLFSHSCRSSSGYFRFRKTLQYTEGVSVLVCVRPQQRSGIPSRVYSHNTWHLTLHVCLLGFDPYLHHLTLSLGHFKNFNPMLKYELFVVRSVNERQKSLIFSKFVFFFININTVFKNAKINTYINFFLILFSGQL